MVVMEKKRRNVSLCKNIKWILRERRGRFERPDCGGGTSYKNNIYNIEYIYEYLSSLILNLLQKLFIKVFLGKYGILRKHTHTQLKIQYLININ